MAPESAMRIFLPMALIQKRPSRDGGAARMVGLVPVVTLMRGAPGNSR